jgi:hypothetical protein
MGAVIENCHTTGAISLSGTTSETGGIAGHLEASVINCSATGNISVVTTAGGASVGGIAGQFAGEGQNGSIINSFTTGNVSASAAGTSRAGGIAGNIYYESGRTVILRNCYATGNVSSTATGTEDSRAGGLVGSYGNSGGTVTVEYCYASGDVSAAGSSVNIAGGIAGRVEAGATTACAALNQNISGSASNSGRIAGLSSGGTLQNNIAYDGMEVNSVTVSMGDADTHDGINGLSKTNTELSNQATYTGWDFSTVWKMQGSRPVLQWQP